DTARLLKDFAASGFVNVLGGCCGTTPDHIAAIGRAVADVRPRVDLPAKSAFAHFSGLETLTIRPDTNFLMIGERTNVTGSARFAELIRKDDYGTAAQVAAEQVRSGANLIDVNMDEGMLDGERPRTTFLKLIATKRQHASVP